jgi:uncharacterized protein
LSNGNFNDSDLFGNLDGFGFGDLSDISLYNKDSEDKKQKANDKHLLPEDLIYDKNLICPVCNKEISIKVVKTSGIRTISRDSDFMIYYGEPNPLFYDAWMCKSCGYAALSTKFSNVSDKQIKLIKDNISSKWKFNKIYPSLYNADVALEMYQLVLLNIVVKAGKDSEKAMICLKIAWLFRLKKDMGNEKKYLLQTINGLCNAFEKEAFPIAGMDQPTVSYLIGELYRRIGDNANAIIWFGRALLSKDAKPKIKEMVRTQKELITNK